MTEAYQGAGSLQEDWDSRLIPHYQPIIALDTRRIMGYEALGRIRTSQGVRSLGPFFGDKTVPMSEQIRVDRLLREQALIQFAGDNYTSEQGKLFINLKPSWIYQTYIETGELPTLRLLDKYRIDPRSVVIEITEESFLEPMEQLRSVVDVYREQGCLIAIDDVGSGFSNMDRIAQIEPHILKIDIHMLQKSERHSGYYAVLRSFSALAEQIGASLLVEGVETEQDLGRAIEIGARYVQGYLFAPAEPKFRSASYFASLIEAGLEKCRSHIIQVERSWNAEAEKLRSIVDAAWQDDYSDSDLSKSSNDFIEQLLPILEPSCIRVYMCCEDGIQHSANYRRDDGVVWRRENSFRGHNWSWRPYFIPISVEKRAMVSRTYTDLDSFDRIRTISVPVGKSGILFLDMIDPEGER